MNSAYTDTIRRWAADDRRVGTLADADGIGEVGLGEGEAGRRLAVRFALRVRDDRIETVRYQVYGCGFTIAACAAAAELAEGHTLAEVAAIAPPRVDAALEGLPPERDYCAVLAVEALQAAVASAHAGHRVIAAAIDPGAAGEQAPSVTADHLVYQRLLGTPSPPALPKRTATCLPARWRSRPANRTRSPPTSAWKRTS